MRAHHLLFVLIAAIPSAAMAQTAAPATSTAAASDTAPAAPALDQNEIICKHLDAPTGSRLPGPSVCRTRADWDFIQKNAERDIRELQIKGGQMYTPPPGVKGTGG